MCNSSMVDSFSVSSIALFNPAAIEAELTTNISAQLHSAAKSINTPTLNTIGNKFQLRKFLENFDQYQYVLDDDLIRMVQMIIVNSIYGMCTKLIRLTLCNNVALVPINLTLLVTKYISVTLEQDTPITILTSIGTDKTYQFGTSDADNSVLTADDILNMIFDACVMVIHDIRDMPQCNIISKSNSYRIDNMINNTAPLDFSMFIDFQVCRYSVLANRHLKDNVPRDTSDAHMKFARLVFIVSSVLEQVLTNCGVSEEVIEARFLIPAYRFIAGTDTGARAIVSTDETSVWIKYQYKNSQDKDPLFICLFIDDVNPIISGEMDVNVLYHLAGELLRLMTLTIDDLLAFPL